MGLVTNYMKNQTILVFILAVVALGVGFLIGRMTAPVDNYSPKDLTEKSTLSSEKEMPTESDNTLDSETSTKISTDSLTPEQRQLLTSLGINAGEIDVTPEMISCAEAKLGVTRVNEIKEGATPTFSEGFILVACYK